MVAITPIYLTWMLWVLIFSRQKALCLVTEVFCDSYNFLKNLHSLFAESSISMHFTYGSIKKNCRSRDSWRQWCSHPDLLSSLRFSDQTALCYSRDFLQLLLSLGSCRSLSAEPLYHNAAATWFSRSLNPQMHRKLALSYQGNFCSLLEPTGPSHPSWHQGCKNSLCSTCWPSNAVWVLSMATHCSVLSCREGWPGSQSIRCMENNFSLSFSMGKLEAQNYSPEEIKECLKKKEITKWVI